MSLKIIIEKYKKSMYGDNKNTVVAMMVSFVILCPLLLVGIVKNITCVYFIIIGILAIVTGCHIYNNVRRTKEYEANSVKELLDDKNDKFKKFLAENDLLSLKDRNILRNMCREKLMECNKKSNFIMPILAMIIPICTAVLVIVMKDLAVEEILKLVSQYIWFVLLMCAEVKGLEYIVSDLQEEKYRYIKKMIEDLDTYELLK